MKLLQGRVKSVIGVALACSVGVFSCLGYVNNASMVVDMRQEGARWRVFADALNLDTASSTDVKVIWAPRFASGSWFTVLPGSYWTDYAAAHFRRKLTVKTTDFTLSDVTAGAAVVDYHLFNDGRDRVVTLAHVDRTSDRLEHLSVDRIAVKLSDASPNMLNHLYLSYVDQNGAVAQTRLANLPDIAGRSDLRQLDGIKARPEGIVVSDQSTIAILPINCPDILPSVMRLTFGSNRPSTTLACQAVSMLRAGWWPPDTAGVWSVAATTDLMLSPSADRNTPLTVMIDASSYTALGFYNGVQTVDVRVGQHPVATWTFSTSGPPPDTRLVIPPEFREIDGRVHFTFTIRDPIVPQAVGKGPDTRPLGLVLCAINISSVPGNTPTLPPVRGCATGG